MNRATMVVLVVLLLVAFPADAQAQRGTISGTVTNADSVATNDSSWWSEFLEWLRQLPSF